MPLRNYPLASFLGLNTEVSEFKLKDWEATDLKNVDVDYKGYLRNRNGYSRVNSTAITDEPNVLGLYKFYKDGLDDPLFICGAGSLLHYLDGSNVWQGITGATGFSGARWNFISHQNKCYAANNTDTPQVITASNSTLSAANWSGGDLSNNPPIEAPFIIEHRDRIFIAGGEVAGTSKASRVMYTDTATPPDVTGAGNTGIGILEGDGQAVTGINKLGFNLIVFKNHQIHHISGCSAADFTRRQLKQMGGSYSHRSIVNTDNTLIMLHKSGILNFNGASLQDMSLNIKSKIDGIDEDYIQNACGVFYNNRYWLSYTLDNDETTNDETLVIDAISGACTVYDYGVNAFYLDKDNNLYGAANSGFVWLLDSGRYDVTSDIASSWTSRYMDFNMPGVTKDLKEVVVYTSLESESFTFTFYVDQDRQNWEKTVTPASSTLKEVRFSVNREMKGKRFKLKIEHDGHEAYRIEEIIFRFEPTAREGVRADL